MNSPRTREITTPGHGLIDEFRTAQMAIAVVERAKAKASQSEEKALNSLHSFKSNEEVYVKPTDIPKEFHDPVSYESLNAHFQKIQAMQMESHSYEKYRKISAGLEAIYSGKKITIKVLDRKTRPIAIKLKHKGSAGHYYTSSKARTITGLISGIDLCNNILTLRPTVAVKLFNSSIKGYQLFVINPYSLEPLVSLSL